MLQYLFMSEATFAVRGVVFIVAQVIAVATSVASLGMLSGYLINSSYRSALRGVVVVLAAALLTDAVVLVQLRVQSPDVTFKWYFVPAILGEGAIVGLVGFVACESALRYGALVTSALAPLMLICVRGIER